MKQLMGQEKAELGLTPGMRPVKSLSLPVPAETALRRLKEPLLTLSKDVK